MRYGLVFLLLLHLLLIPSSAQSSDPPNPNSICFPRVAGVVDCIDARFRSFWKRNGGLSVFGYPVGPLLPEETSDGLYAVQYLERNRFEFHAENEEPYRVLLGRLGVELLRQRGIDWRSLPSVGSAPQGCRYFSETRHSLCDAFLRYWESHGLELDQRPGNSYAESLALFGYPISEPRMETNASGHRVLIQWFERARLEYHPGNPKPYRVLQGRLNVELQDALTPDAPAAGFVEVAGDRLVQRGQQIFLKGINYYPADHPWGFMWTEWDAQTVSQDLARASRELGINTVRTLVPYERKHGWTDGRGHVRPAMLDRLRQFVQIAGQNRIKVIITLFDWRDGVSPAGSTSEEYELRYLRTIVNAFRDDDRVLAWDLHNEPDAYPAWEDGKAALVVDWLGRMADALRALDRRHPVTVGVARVESLWQTAPNGRTIAEISDIISVHNYDAAKFSTIVRETRSRTSKPILLEEFGWPTGPECHGPYYNEPSQLHLFRQAINAPERSQLVGMLSWWLQDIPLTAYNPPADENDYFGLYDHAGKPKAAVAPFRAVRVPPLPSTTTSTYKLTVVPSPYDAPAFQPLIFDNGMVLNGEFKHFWLRFGGKEIFGVPLTLAYRDQNDTVVQYFENARFELNEAAFERIDPTRPEQSDELYLKRVHLTPLGQWSLGDRSFPRVADPGKPDALYVHQTGHTLSGEFRAFWERYGAGIFGLPLSEPLDEVRDGRPVRVQYFSNVRFEQVSGGPVQLAPLGAAALQVRRCPSP